MIRKAYHANGSPDLRNWTVQCDNSCPNTVPILNATPSGWVIGRRENGRCYCPACAYLFAARLISWALVCPVCGSPQLTIGTDSNGTAEFALCDGECRTTYLADDGWHCTCCGDLIIPPPDGTN
ncbi:unnamed protein product [[Actinomadura] parvosata subsp. kistnae]|uniref:Uncharacterized protein n=1 Tax=[Actinomadura] parvosata subsp. kistnae TaxID=1909395 RepID=A0A1V0A5R2_9ACTN|nr:hypothetical protein [Nonomuraea sp. ATCC 55076]AQZ65543.1 hypothetical protein BKM31_32435 [Nonomuraea sp. ATCC 55076]SPL96904.1 unnamed protein product [Actinomadura parvosata subsp. kistnae]